MASLLSQVFFQCPIAYLLWKVLKWAGGEGRGVRNVYKGIGLNGGWGLLGGWVVGVETDVVLLGPPIPHLRIVPMHHRQSGRYVRKWISNSNQLLVWKYCQDPYQVPAFSGEVRIG